MTEFAFFYGVLKDYGPWGLWIAYFAYKKLMPFIKKRRGTYVSYTDLDRRIKKVESDMQVHLAEAKRGEIAFAKFTARQDEINSSVIDRLDQNHDSFNTRLNELREQIDRAVTLLSGMIRGWTKP